MAEVSENISGVQEEMRRLRDEVADMAKNLGQKNREAMDSIGRKLSEEFQRYRDSDEAQKLIDAGEAGLARLCEQVRKRPVSSMLVAFGAGAVLACLLRR